MSLPGAVRVCLGAVLALPALLFAQNQSASRDEAAAHDQAVQATLASQPVQAEAAQAPPQAASPSDPASAADAKPMRVARLTFLAGAVRVERVDNTAGEDQPVLNMPLVEGTRLVTGDYGQAEVEFEDGSVVRLTPRSALSLDVLALTDGAARTQMTLLGGMGYFELRKAPGYAYLLQVAGMLVTPAANVTLRINADEPAANISVLTGEVRVEQAGKETGGSQTDGFKATVRQGESLRGDSKDESRYFLNAQIAPESWDQWNESRDAAAADDADVRTTARDGFAGQQGYGWSDLDANGSWYDIPGQGQTWQPAAADDGFDPYGYGSWVYVNTSYVWVSGYAWGWTPFRCGRWNYTTGFGWGWLPGRSCGVFGFAGEEGGYGGVHVFRGPPHYSKPLRPLPGPPHGPVHPIVIVHGPDGARPPLKGGPVVVGKTRLDPLKPVGNGPGRGAAVIGQALNRDFPVDRTTGSPIFGREVSGAQDTLVVGGGWVPVQGKPAAGSQALRSGVVSRGGGQQPPIPLSPPPADRGGRPVPTSPVATPVVTPPGIRVPLQPVAPLGAPQPVRSAPVQSAPVRVAPPPAAAPVQAPATKVAPK